MHNGQNETPLCLSLNIVLYIRVMDSYPPRKGRYHFHKKSYKTAPNDDVIFVDARQRSMRPGNIC